MKTIPVRKFPIGVQDLGELRKDNYLYVDKTALAYHLIATGKAYFLNRPNVILIGGWLGERIFSQTTPKRDKFYYICPVIII